MPNNNGWFNNDNFNNNNENPRQNNNREPDDWNPMSGPPRTPGQSFAMTSIVFAIFGIVTFFMILTPILFGSLAVIFGLLSRGEKKRPDKPASIAIPLGTAAVVLGVVILVAGIFMILNQFGGLENYYHFIEQQVMNSQSGGGSTLDLSQFAENFMGV